VSEKMSKRKREVKTEVKAEVKVEVKKSWAEKSMDALGRDEPTNKAARKLQDGSLLRARRAQGTMKALDRAAPLTTVEASTLKAEAIGTVNKRRYKGSNRPGLIGLSLKGRKSYAAFTFEDDFALASASHHALGVSQFIVSVPLTNDAEELVRGMLKVLHYLADHHAWTPETRVQLTLEGNNLGEDGMPQNIWIFSEGTLSGEEAKWRNFKLEPTFRRYVLACQEKNDEKYKPVFLHRMRVITAQPPVGGCGDSQNSSALVTHARGPAGDQACGWRAIFLGWYEIMNKPENADDEKAYDRFTTKWKALLKQNTIKGGVKSPSQDMLRAFSTFQSEFKLDLAPVRPIAKDPVYTRRCTYEDMVQLSVDLTSKLHSLGRTGEVRIRVFSWDPWCVVSCTPSLNPHVRRWEAARASEDEKTVREIMDTVDDPFYIRTGPDALSLSDTLDGLHAAARASNIQPLFINLIRSELEEGFHYDFLKAKGVGNVVYGKDHYCEKCHTAYTQDYHKCKLGCNSCKSYQCAGRFSDGIIMQCYDCRRRFNGQACFDRHKTPSVGGKSLCDAIFVCRAYGLDDDDEHCQKCPVKHFHLTHRDIRCVAAPSGGQMRPWWTVPPTVDQDGEERQDVEAFITEHRLSGAAADSVRQNYYTLEELEDYTEWPEHRHNTKECPRCKKQNKGIIQPFEHVHHMCRNEKRCKELDVDQILCYDAETRKRPEADSDEDEDGERDAYDSDLEPPETAKEKKQREEDAMCPRKEEVNCLVVGWQPKPSKEEAEEFKQPELVLKAFDTLDSYIRWLLFERPAAIIAKNKEIIAEFDRENRGKRMKARERATLLSGLGLTRLDETFCLAHNAAKFDTHLMLQGLWENEALHQDYQVETPIRKGTQLVSLTIIPKELVRDEKGKVLQKGDPWTSRGKITLHDTCLHLPHSLKELANTYALSSTKDHFPHLLRTSEGPRGMGWYGAVPPIQFFEPTKENDGDSLKELLMWHDEEQLATTKRVANLKLSFADKNKKQEYEALVSRGGLNPRYKYRWNARDVNKTYCMQDVRLLLQIWHKYRAGMLAAPIRQEPTRCVTLPSLCKKIQLNMMHKNLEMPVFINKEAKWFRPFLKGGRTEVFKMQVEIKDPSMRNGIARADARSLYPSCMLNLYMTAAGRHYNEEETEAFGLSGIVDLIKDEAQIVFAELSGHYTKFVYAPPLHSKSAEGKLVFALNDIKKEKYASVEIRLALEEGFVIDRVHTFHHWNASECSRELFRPYLNHFYTQKVEQGGIVEVLKDYLNWKLKESSEQWCDDKKISETLKRGMDVLIKTEKLPLDVWRSLDDFCERFKTEADMTYLFKHITGQADLRSAAEFILQQTVVENKKKGIDVDTSKLTPRKNKTGVSTAKLMINSLWGQIGQRLEQRTVTRYMTQKDEKEFWTVLNDKAFNVSVLPVTKDRNEITVRRNPDGDTADATGSEISRLPHYTRLLLQNEESEGISIPIASLVTAYGRASLHKMLRGAGSKLIGCDTDSVMYHQDGSVKLDTGIAIGDYVIENDLFVPEVKWYSFGPKFYTIISAEGKVIKFKAKGLSHKKLTRAEFSARLPSVDVAAVRFMGDILNGEVMAQALTEWKDGGSPTITVAQSQLRRTPKDNYALYFHEMLKKAGINADKRVFFHNTETGWIDSWSLGYENFVTLDEEVCHKIAPGVSLKRKEMSREELEE
jgi:hypothetical protein